MIFRMVETAAPGACCKRAVAWPNASRRLEFRNLQPSDERPCSNAGDARGLLYTGLRKQGGDRVFFLATEFLSVPSHQAPPDAKSRPPPLGIGDNTLV